MRNALTNLVLAACAALAAPGAARAQNDRYAICYVFTVGGDGTAISFPPHKLARGEPYGIYNEGKLLEMGVPGANGYRSATCDTASSLEEAEARYVKSGYRMVKRLDWPKGYWSGANVKAEVPKAPPTPPKTGREPASAPALIAKPDTSLRDAGKAWEEQVKKSLAAEAQRKVETAAKAAQADAKQKAQIEAFFAQRRRQGSAQ